MIPQSILPNDLTPAPQPPGGAPETADSRKSEVSPADKLVADQASALRSISDASKKKDLDALDLLDVRVQVAELEIKKGEQKPRVDTIEQMRDFVSNVNVNAPPDKITSEPQQPLDLKKKTTGVFDDGKEVAPSNDVFRSGTGIIQPDGTEWVSYRQFDERGIAIPDTEPDTENMDGAEPMSSGKRQVGIGITTVEAEADASPVVKPPTKEDKKESSVKEEPVTQEPEDNDAADMMTAILTALGKIKSSVSLINSRLDDIETRLDDIDTPEEYTPMEASESFEYGLDVDYCYTGIKKIEIPERTTDFLKIYLDGVTTPEWVESMPTGDQDVDAIVYDVNKRRIYLNGETAG